MSLFLNDRELGPAIIELLDGTELRCAVAFWGKGAVRKLFENGIVPKNARIVCDLIMGGTNPEELRALGAPTNKNLRHSPGLHAKVYVSSQGLIVCSSNASNNGIGFLDPPRLLEAGTLHRSTTNTYRSASQWFEEIWEAAKDVDDSAIAHAEDAWARRLAGNYFRATRHAYHPESLLDSVVANPAAFRGVGFAFTTGNSTKEQRDETAVSVAEKDDENPTRLLSRKDRTELPQWPVGDVFSEWPPEDVDRWPKRFVCIHRPPRAQRLSYWFYERAYTAVLDGGRGMLLGRRPPGLRHNVGFSTSARRMAEIDNEKASHIFASIRETEHAFFANGEELVRLLVTLPPWR
jgi:hypothetical protein